MIDFEFKREGSDVGLILSALASAGQDEMAGLVLRAAQHAEGEIRAVCYDVFPEGRTGALPRSFRATFIGRETNIVSAAARSDLVYAGIQDQGGTITPKSVQYLAVPVKRLPVGKWPRHFSKDELKYIGKSRAGNPMLGKVGKRSKRVEPYFVLVKSVTIKGRGYIAIAADRAAPGIEEIMAEGLTRFVDRVSSSSGSGGGA